MTKKQKRKKSDQDNSLQIIVLVTAILNLLDKLIELIEKYCLK